MIGRSGIFFGMAAYSYGYKRISSRNIGSMGVVRKRLYDEFHDPSITDKTGEYNRLNRTWLAVAAPWAAADGTRFSGSALKLPHDYQYDDAEPESKVTPLTIFGDPPEIGPEPRDRIGRYAEWMTSPENAAFTRVIANRLWERVFGVRLHAISPAESVDDMSLGSKSLHPELFEFLCDQMIAMDYDLRGFLGMLYKTRLFQNGATAEDIPADISGYAFRGPVLKRASAEQIWDSLVGLINPRPNDGYWVNRMTLAVRRRTLNEYHHALTTWDEDALFDAILKVRAEMKEEQPRLDARVAEITESHRGTQRELADKLKSLKNSSEFTGQHGFIYRHVYEPALAAAGPPAKYSIRLPAGRGELEIRDRVEDHRFETERIVPAGTWPDSERVDQGGTEVAWNLRRTRPASLSEIPVRGPKRLPGQ